MNGLTDLDHTSHCPQEEQDQPTALTSSLPSWRVGCRVLRKENSAAVKHLTETKPPNGCTLCRGLTLFLGRNGRSREVKK